MLHRGTKSFIFIHEIFFHISHLGKFFYKYGYFNCGLFELSKSTIELIETHRKYMSCILFSGIGCIPHPSCVFPFKYKDVTHSSCTDANNNGKYWCSPTAEYVVGSKTDLPCDCKFSGKRFYAALRPVHTASCGFINMYLNYGS